MNKAELLKLLEESFLFEEKAIGTYAPFYENLLESSPLSPAATKEALQILKTLHHDTVCHFKKIKKMQRYVEKNEKNEY